VTRYRTKTVELVNAIQWTGSNEGEIARFVDDGSDNPPLPLMIDQDFLPGSPRILLIPTTDGELRAYVGEWIIRASWGLYLLEPYIFWTIYEPVGDEA